VSRSLRPTRHSASPSVEPPAPRVHLARGPRKVAAVRRLIGEYGRSLGVDLGFQGFHDELTRLPGEYVPPRGRLLYATLGREVVGCVGVRPLTATICEMKRLYVLPSCRGRGVGRALVEVSMAEAATAGYRRMRLDTLGTMRSAIQLYRSVGFREIRPYRFNPIPGARYFEVALSKDPPRPGVAGRSRTPPLSAR
jgi:putative acetyltransferase